MRAAVFALLTVLALPPGAGHARDLEREEGWEARMLEQINGVRAERGLPRLRAERRLAAAAAVHSQRMARTGRLSHRLAGEPELTQRVAATGLRFDAVAENVAYSTRVDELHGNLMRSSRHRVNLLARKFDSIGLAIYRNGDRFWVTQDFAHSTSEVSEEGAEHAYAEAAAALRRERGLPTAAVSATQELRDAACSMALRDLLDLSLYPERPGRRHVVAFTTFEPERLEGAARDAATDPDAETITIGVCQRESKRYPNGVYWFAVAY
jgi:hypothetical protein